MQEDEASTSKPKSANLESTASEETRTAAHPAGSLNTHVLHAELVPKPSRAAPFTVSVCFK